MATNQQTLCRTEGLPATTTRVVGPIEQPDERRQAFMRVRAGELGPELQKAFTTFVGKYPIAATLQWSGAQTAHLVDGPISPNKIEIKDVARATRHVKQLARFFRADLVGICELPRFAVYSHSANGTPVELNHRYAIGIIVDQNYETMRGSTGMDMVSAAQSFVSYSHSGFVAIQLAQYLRRLGYPARAHYCATYQVAITPILLYAGLGEMSRSGMLLTKEMGLRFKGAAVTTDFPLVPDKPIDLGMQSFCEMCKKCARFCPSKAISEGGKTVHNGRETWHTDVEKCVSFRVGNKVGSSCGRCIKVCPWNRGNTLHHKLALGAARRSRLAQRALIEIDDMLRSNLKAEDEYRWWRLEDFADMTPYQPATRGGDF